MKKEEKLKKVKDISLRECNSFFKRVILKKENIDTKYLFLYIKAFTKNIESSLGIKVSLKIVPKDYFEKKYDLKDCLGRYQCDKNQIFIREDLIYELKDKPVKCFNVLLHEIYHAYQEKCYRENYLSYANYRYTEERILCENGYYYFQNYSFLTIEKEANKFAKNFTKAYLLKIIYNLDKIEENIFSKDYCESLSNYDSAGNIKKLDELFSSYLKKNKILLLRYPLLRYEYDLSANRRSTVEILKKMEKEKDVVKIEFLKELLIKREFPLYYLILDYIELLIKRDNLKDKDFIDSLLKEYLYYKLERELSLTSLDISIPLIHDIIFKLKLPKDKELKELFEKLEYRLKEKVKINRKIKFKIKKS